METTKGILLFLLLVCLEGHVSPSWHHAKKHIAKTINNSTILNSQIHNLVKNVVESATEKQVKKSKAFQEFVQLIKNKVDSELKAVYEKNVLEALKETEDNNIEPGTADKKLAKNKPHKSAKNTPLRKDVHHVITGKPADEKHALQALKEAQNTKIGSAKTANKLAKNKPVHSSVGGKPGEENHKGISKKLHGKLPQHDKLKNGKGLTLEKISKKISQVVLKPPVSHHHKDASNKVGEIKDIEVKINHNKLPIDQEKTHFVNHPNKSPLGQTKPHLINHPNKPPLGQTKPHLINHPNKPPLGQTKPHLINHSNKPPLGQTKPHLMSHPSKLSLGQTKPHVSNAKDKDSQLGKENGSGIKTKFAKYRGKTPSSGKKHQQHKPLKQRKPLKTMQKPENHKEIKPTHLNTQNAKNIYKPPTVSQESGTSGKDTQTKGHNIPQGTFLHINNTLQTNNEVRENHPTGIKMENKPSVPSGDITEQKLPIQEKPQENNIMPGSGNNDQNKPQQNGNPIDTDSVHNLTENYHSEEDNKPQEINNPVDTNNVYNQAQNNPTVPSSNQNKPTDYSKPTGINSSYYQTQNYPSGDANQTKPNENNNPAGTNNVNNLPQTYASRAGDQNKPNDNSKPTVVNTGYYQQQNYPSGDTNQNKPNENNNPAGTNNVNNLLQTYASSVGDQNKPNGNSIPTGVTNTGYYQTQNYPSGDTNQNKPNENNNPAGTSNVNNLPQTYTSSDQNKPNDNSKPTVVNSGYYQQQNYPSRDTYKLPENNNPAGTNNVNYVQQNYPSTGDYKNKQTDYVYNQQQTYLSSNQNNPAQNNPSGDTIQNKPAYNPTGASNVYNTQQNNPYEKSNEQQQNVSPTEKTPQEPQQNSYSSNTQQTPQYNTYSSRDNSQGYVSSNNPAANPSVSEEQYPELQLHSDINSSGYKTGIVEDELYEGRTKSFLEGFIKPLQYEPMKSWYYNYKFHTMNDLHLTPVELHNGYHNKGNPSRLANALLKALRGEDIHMAIVGGSISAGAGVCDDMETLDGVYFNVLRDWWEKTITKWTGSRLIIHNGAVGAMESLYQFYCMSTQIGEAEMQKLDIVLWEMSVNDRGRYGSKNGECASPFPPGFAIERLTRHFSNLPNHPAVIFINFFSRGFFRQRHKMNVDCENAEDEGVTSVAVKYGIPSLSWKTEVCPSFLARKLYFSIADLFASDKFHPNDLGHAQMSILLINFVRLVFKQLILAFLYAKQKFTLRDSDITLPAPSNVGTGIDIQPVCWTNCNANTTYPNPNPLSRLDIVTNDGFQQCPGPQKVNVRKDFICPWNNIKVYAVLRFRVNIPQTLTGVGRDVIIYRYVLRFPGTAEIWLDDRYDQKLVSVYTDEGTCCAKADVIPNVPPGIHLVTIRVLEGLYGIVAIFF